MKNDNSKIKILYFAALGLSVLRLYFAYKQMTYLVAAPIDDYLYYEWANSILKGQWLGEYNYLTLSKYPFFAIYLALVHISGIPFLVANCLLWVALSLLAVWALSPILKNTYLKIALYLVVLYSPQTFAKYTLRVYRDSIFPILCTAFFLAFAGLVLRIKDSPKKYRRFSVIAGVMLGLAWITREDGYWLLPFGVVASFIGIIYVVIDKKLIKKTYRIFALVAPYLITVLITLTICNINYKHYGLFTLSDFSQGAFAQCYGNMTRLSHKEWDPVVAVPLEVREKLYSECPSFEILKSELEKGGLTYKAYSNKEKGDYKSGAFYWALRRAAQTNGIYKDAQTAQNYWQRLSNEIEIVCQNDPNALSPRKSVTPPIKLEYVQPVIKTALDSAIHVFALKDMQSCETELSDITLPYIYEWASFCNDDSNYAAIENSYLPYYTFTQIISYKIMDSITWIYRVLLTPMFICALVRWGKNAIKFKSLSFKRQITLFVIFGLIMMAIFRIFIISYMEIAAFEIGIYSMYLGAIYPIVTLVAFVGNTLWIKE